MCFEFFFKEQNFPQILKIFSRKNKNIATESVLPFKFFIINFGKISQQKKCWFVFPNMAIFHIPSYPKVGFIIK
jgi:hypothetical protein